MEPRSPEGDPLPLSDEHVPTNQGKPKSVVVNVREQERKRRKVADEEGNTIIAVLGHSFINHLTARIKFIANRDTISWEEVMSLEDEEVRVRYKGESGARRFYFPEFSNYVATNNAEKALIEMGSNDLMDQTNPGAMADQIVDRALELIRDNTTLTKCMLCCVIPRTKTKDSDRYNVRDFKKRMKDFNERLKYRVNRLDCLKYWVHDRLMEPTEDLMDDKGIHPRDHGMDLYVRSISRAISNLKSW
jgi:hypothetical protein